MADASFDVVVVGGGTKGLATALYLAKYGGMSVGIFEESHELGGGLAGEQIAPGIQCNSHAGSHQWWYYGTVIKDDFPELYEEGLQLHNKLSSLVFGWDDDTCLTIYGTDVDPDGSRSAAQFARFSEKDAETFLRMRDVYYNCMQPAEIEEAFSVATPLGVPGPMAKAFANPAIAKAGLDKYASSMTVEQAAKYFYDSPEAQYMILKMSEVLAGTGVGLQAMLGIYSFLGQLTIVGGTHNLAHVMHRVLHKYGAKTYTHCGVDKVVIENGTAKGIILKDGSRIEAKQAVISTLSPHQLCYDLIGAENLSSDILRKIDILESSIDCVIGMTIAFAEPPKLKCSSFNPDVYNDEMRTGINWFNLGPKSPDALFEHAAHKKFFKVPGYQVPAPKLMNIVADPDDAKFSRDTNVAQWLFFNTVPPAYSQTPEYWKKLSEDYPELIIKELGKYVDGATWDNVVGVMTRTPYWVAKHLPNMGPSGNVNIIDMIPSQMGSCRPIPEMAQHRTPIKGLYATGSAFGNWGMSSLCSAYTCYKVVSEDYGLKMPWKEKGRAY